MRINRKKHRQFYCTVLLAIALLIAEYLIIDTIPSHSSIVAYHQEHRVIK